MFVVSAMNCRAGVAQINENFQQPMQQEEAQTNVSDNVYYKFTVKRKKETDGPCRATKKKPDR